MKNIFFSLVLIATSTKAMENVHVPCPFTVVWQDQCQPSPRHKRNPPFMPTLPTSIEGDVLPNVDVVANELVQSSKSLEEHPIRAFEDQHNQTDDEKITFVVNEQEARYFIAILDRLHNNSASPLPSASILGNEQIGAQVAAISKQVDQLENKRKKDAENSHKHINKLHNTSMERCTKIVKDCNQNFSNHSIRMQETKQELEVVKGQLTEVTSSTKELAEKYDILTQKIHTLEQALTAQQPRIPSKKKTPWYSCASS